MLLEVSKGAHPRRDARIAKGQEQPLSAAGSMQMEGSRGAASLEISLLIRIPSERDFLYFSYFSFSLLDAIKR